MSKVNVCICYIDKISNIFLITNQHFEMFLKIQSDPRIDELLHLLIASINSNLEKSGHSAC